MLPTTSYKRGDVILVPFPFTDLSASKQRPALVISSDASNISRSDIIVVAITSHIPTQLAADEITIPQADVPATGLQKPSIIKAGKIVTIHQDLVRKKIGVLPASTLRSVLERIQKMFAS